ncbi:hypothetical protein CSE15_16270 [Bacillus altitudinis]|uniref:hypothetical protein n=1 Tax=Bacillus altitudinis TaxID=293387 RepID=UPI000C1593B2|nr:hypothetical protein [Bacillus altitudinis]ATP95401.1 hypothetical protein CSE15_16270 [Bacillus altitudinis]
MAENKRESVGILNVKVDVDVSEAIKGLKAVQREAKAATKALAEFRDITECLGEKTMANGSEVGKALRALLDTAEGGDRVYEDPPE